MEHLGWVTTESSVGIEVGETLLDFASHVTADSLASFRHSVLGVEEFLCGRIDVARLGVTTFPRKIVFDPSGLALDDRRGPVADMGFLIETDNILPEHINTDTLELSPQALSALKDLLGRSERPLIAAIGMLPCAVLAPECRTDRWEGDFVTMIVDDVAGWASWAESVASGYSFERCLASVLGISTEVGPLDASDDLTPIGRTLLLDSLTHNLGR